MEFGQLFAWYAIQSGFLLFKNYYRKLLLDPILDPLHVTNDTLQHSEPSTNDSYWLVVPQKLVPRTIYKARFLLSRTYTPVFSANTMLQCNNSSTNYISEIELWETTVTNM